MITLTYDLKNIKNPNYHLETLQSKELFTNDYFSITENIRINILNEQLSIYVLSKLKYKNHSSYLKYILLLSGDINLHPGPVKYACSICNKAVRKRQISCNNCGLWIHKNCVPMRIPNNEFQFTCHKCLNHTWQQLPFPDEDPEEHSQIDPNETLNNNLDNLTDINSWKVFKTHGLHFLHLNINSVLSKIEELRLIAKNSEATVIGITESKLDETVLDGEINIEGYKLIRSDRNRHGGGVACYVNNNVSFNIRSDFSTDIENIFIDILLPKTKPLLLGILY